MMALGVVYLIDTSTESLVDRSPEVIFPATDNPHGVNAAFYP
tara:strand:+ start:504 stop:629 length:126 start_codon:yes stop_codon:yes gene_type:complete